VRSRVMTGADAADEGERSAGVAGSFRAQDTTYSKPTTPSKRIMDSPVLV
jgi:hypothetical protein